MESGMITKTDIEFPGEHTQVAYETTKIEQPRKKSRRHRSGSGEGGKRTSHHDNFEDLPSPPDTLSDAPPSMSRQDSLSRGVVSVHLSIYTMK